MAFRVEIVLKNEIVLVIAQFCSNVEVAGPKSRFKHKSQIRRVGWDIVGSEDLLFRLSLKLLVQSNHLSFSEFSLVVSLDQVSDIN